MHRDCPYRGSAVEQSIEAETPGLIMRWMPAKKLHLDTFRFSQLLPLA